MSKMFKYTRLEEEGQESILRRSWRRMRDNVRETWKEFKGILAQKPVKKDINLSKMGNPGWNWVETKELGTLTKGGFGRLKFVENSKTHKAALEKIISKDMESSESFKEAVLCLKICKKDDHFLKIIAVSENPSYYSLYLEHFNAIPVGSLHGNKLQPWMLSTIVSAVGKALCCLHSKGILHRQITGQNILINDRLQVKLIGFELAKVCNESTECVGTIGYMAPEIISHNYRLIQYMTSATDFETVTQISATYEKYGLEADYFSLGVVIFDMFFNQPPSFFGLDTIETEYLDDARLFSMYECNIMVPSNPEETTSDTFSIFKNLMVELLAVDSKLRPTGENFEKHMVFQDFQTSRPPETSFINLQHYMKPTSEIEKASALEVITHPEEQYMDSMNQSSLEDVFLYLATRPESFSFWKDVLEIFYAEKYKIYKAIWDLMSRSLSTLTRSTSEGKTWKSQGEISYGKCMWECFPVHPPQFDCHNLSKTWTRTVMINLTADLGFIWTSEDDDTHRSEDFFPTPSEESVHPSPIIDLESHVVALSPQLTGSSSATSFQTTVSHRTSSDIFSFCGTPDYIVVEEEEDGAPILQLPPAPTEIEEMAGLEPETQENFFSSMILWIAFIVLCILFLAKSIYSLIVTERPVEEDSTTKEDDASPSDSDEN